MKINELEKLLIYEILIIIQKLKRHLKKYLKILQFNKTVLSLKRILEQQLWIWIVYYELHQQLKILK
jgi:hypothetical protein